MNKFIKKINGGFKFLFTPPLSEIYGYFHKYFNFTPPSDVCK